MSEQTLEPCGVLRQLKGSALGTLCMSYMGSGLPSPSSVLSSLLLSLRLCSVLIWMESASLTRDIKCGLISFVIQITPWHRPLPTSQHRPLIGSPSFVDNSPRCSLKVVLKEVSLILLLHPPAYLPSALRSSKSMEHTFPHSPAEAGLQRTAGYHWTLGGNGEEFSSCKWVAVVPGRVLLRAGARTQPLLYPSPSVLQWISLRFVCAPQD